MDLKASFFMPRLNFARSSILHWLRRYSSILAKQLNWIKLSGYDWNYNALPRPGSRIAWLGEKKLIWGEREIYSCEFEKSTGAREIYSSVDQTKKVKTKKKVFSTKNYTNSGYGLEILAIFLEFLNEDQKKKVFVPKVLWNPVWIRAVNTNSGVLSLDFHSTSSEPVNFFGAQSSVAGGTSSHLGGHRPGMPPVAPGLALPHRLESLKTCA